MNKASGSALVETVILMTALVPLLLGIPLVGKYLDVKAAALEASRFAVWERTVWSDVSAGWGESENHKSSDRVRTEVSRYVIGHPSTLIDPEALPKRNPLWVSHGQERMLHGVSVTHDDGTTKVLPAEVVQDSRGAPVGSPVVDRFAEGPLLGTALSEATAAIGKQLGALASGCGPGLDFNEGLGLSQNGFAEATITLPARNFIQRDAGTSLKFSSTAAILSNGWTATDVRTYRNRVDRLTVDELVACAVVPGRFTFAVISRGANTPLYGEGIPSYPVLEAFDQSVLPPGRRR